ncbi:MAG: flavin reductase family protein [Sphingomonas bacterium]|uniref:flavin reductase family protein n=1 Tax=Sphingomonas bacterium TaxID=1895847 RepID=UPI00263A3A90|nr:flavin reductase family protein [Sphingomonas bacterium]MDB5712250.1 flavin reductase family protein [Sphingomonas bacterium]
MTEHHFYEPRHGHGLRHDPLNAIVGPRPIGWIGSLNAGGVRNLAPYSFFNLFTYRPPIVGFASTELKDSAANIAASGEFTWNLATRDLAEGMNASSATVAAEIDEFDLAGLAAAPSRLIAAPRVAASPVSFECRLTQQFELTDAEGAGTCAWMTFGEVVAIHIDPAMLEDGVYITARARPIVRGGGAGEYFEITGDRKFEMRRPR